MPPSWISCGPFTDLTLGDRPLVAGEGKEVYAGSLAQPWVMALVGFVPQMQQLD